MVLRVNPYVRERVYVAATVMNGLSMILNSMGYVRIIHL